MTAVAISKGGKPIRLTDERWSHITEEHTEMAGYRLDILETIEEPIRILLGNDGELIAVREIEQGKFIAVIYREFDEDGFVITAFLTKRIRSLDRRIQVWP